ncbi:16S rRNA methyltransferase [Sporosarcina sp. P37]|uniref:class I SAM-dependent methyltransferase n=1 Tax=unclassified Sporosarcina TaxID=2647733 RepID=UPI000A1799F6|nr:MULTISPECIES: class I SAM-dependent methyltransferase [unclassified Sporosarcina]ARK24675.1 16S rRNA methyltransferase [Sporosarcina sp. P37]PID19832.1 class I SAM-dependent methyltransferase [Sporosarcina sp. P35]
MGEHYYSKNPQVSSAPKQWKAEIRNRVLSFTTDAGVFSKGSIDEGSKLLAETFKEPSIGGDFLEIGCGYGPIALSIAMDFSDRTVHMVDVNERALSLSEKNAQHNGIRNVRIYESSGVDSVEQEGFAAIITNPPIRAGKQTVFSFYKGAYEKLAPGGELWVVIQKKQGAPSTMEYLKKLFGNVETVAKKKGYFILRAKKD